MGGSCLQNKRPTQSMSPLPPPTCLTLGTFCPQNPPGTTCNRFWGADDPKKICQRANYAFSPLGWYSSNQVAAKGILHKAANTRQQETGWSIGSASWRSTIWTKMHHPGYRGYRPTALNKRGLMVHSAWISGVGYVWVVGVFRLVSGCWVGRRT